MLVARSAAGWLIAAVALVPLPSQGAPTGVTFKAPAAGATVAGSLGGTGCEVTGTGIARVVFYMDSTQLNTENLSPWNCVVDTRNFPNGSHTLRAVAYDSAGTSTSVTRTVNVQNGTSTSGPTGVTFKAPSAGATVSGSLNSTGCEVTGTGIARVVFYMDNTQLNTENLSPWNCAVDTRSFANGSHTLRAVAYNSAGASTSVTRTVNVQNGTSTSGPTGVTFKAPAAGATISGSLNSTGCEVTGTGIARVVFYMDSTQLNTENLSPWNCAVDTRSFANGSHTLRAVAYNSAGASTSVTRTVNVQNAAASTTAILAWDGVTHPDLRGYRVYYGTAPGRYFQVNGNGVNVGVATSYTVTGLNRGTRYYFAVTAYDRSNNESGFSNEVFKEIP